MKSLPPTTYKSLPALPSPAGYILVIRDIDTDSYRIDATEHPKRYLDDLFADSGRQYGIELVSILQSEDLKVSEALLYERYLATFSGEWLQLDLYQLKELRQSILQLYAHSSQYLRPRPQRLPKSEQQAKTSVKTGPASAARSAQRPQAGRQSPQSPPPAYRRYGTRALRRQGRESARQEAELSNRRISIREAIGDYIDDLWHNHPGRVVASIVVLVLVSLAALDDDYYPAHSLRRGRVLKTAIPARTDPTPLPTYTPDRQAYMVEQIAHVKSCPSKSCTYLGLLPVRTEIFSLGTVRGEEVDGNDAWINFSYFDSAAFVHSSVLSPSKHTYD